MTNLIIEDEFIQGKPLDVERYIMQELATQILTINGATYEDTCYNMRLFADVIEEIEDHINDEIITFKYNPMGSWYRVDGEENE